MVEVLVFGRVPTEEGYRSVEESPISFLTGLGLGLTIAGLVIGKTLRARISKIRHKRG